MTKREDLNAKDAKSEDAKNAKKQTLCDLCASPLASFAFKSSSMSK